MKLKPLSVMGPKGYEEHNTNDGDETRSQFFCLLT